MNGKTAYTYDDIQLVPQYSEIKSRSLINLRTRLTKNLGLCIPYIASPMDTICEYDMAYKMAKLGGVGCIHRFMPIEKQARIVSRLKYTIEDQDAPDGWIEEQWGVMYDDWHTETRVVPIMAAVGANGDYLERSVELHKNGCNVLLIDVAHGHHKMVKEAIQNIKSRLSIDVIAGNVATYDGTWDLIHWGADGVRVGIGGGSLCTTRIQTGHGVPNVTSLMDCVEATMDNDIPIIADGGLRSSGDIAKALAIGASTVMLGSLLAGTQETPGMVIERGNELYKRYRGSASLETKVTHNQPERNVEGESTVVPFKGGVKFVIRKLNDGLRSALSYTGATNLDEFGRKSKFVYVTNSGINEARPHLLK